jgi:hypothetical protein
MKGQINCQNLETLSEKQKVQKWQLKTKQSVHTTVKIEFWKEETDSNCWLCKQHEDNLLTA